MLRTSILLACVILAAACPERRTEAVDTVGGAAGREVDHARVRLDRAETKLQQNSAAAAAVDAR